MLTLGIIFYVLSSSEAGVPGNNGSKTNLIPEGSFNEKGEIGRGNEEGDADFPLENNQLRKEAMAYIAKNIADLSPAEPVLGGTWFVIRFWFVDDTNFYAEYEDGHILRKILVSKRDSRYTVDGFFEPGENDWVLKEGEDAFFGKPLDLYEFDEGTARWVRKN